MAPLYGQVVAGPPGSGKTTYCTGMQEYLRLLGRNAWVINLDPANEVPKKLPHKQKNSEHDNNNDDTITTNANALPYDTLLDICDSVVNLSSVMTQLGLGPNGGLIYCMEYLEAHVEEIVEMIRTRIQENDDDDGNNNNNNTSSSSSPPYLIFDLPGQVELYTHGTAVPRLLERLVKVLDLRLAAIQLIDAHYCTEPANFLSAALLATTTMLRLELPTVSVLSKIDLLANYGPLPMGLEYFAECQELERLLPFLQGGGGGSSGGGDDYDDYDEFDDTIDNSNAPPKYVEDEFDYTEDPDYQKARRKTRASPFFRKHEKLHRVLAEVVDEFGLLSFIPLDISSAESVGRVVARIDKCNGYLFVVNEKTTNKTQDLFQCAVQSSDTTSNYETIADIQERLSDVRENMKKGQQPTPQQQT